MLKGSHCSWCIGVAVYVVVDSRVSGLGGLRHDKVQVEGEWWTVHGNQDVAGLDTRLR